MSSNEWEQPYLDRAQGVSERLETMVEELTELTVDLLHAATAEGAKERPALDKKLQSARRAVEKAARTLAQ